MPVYEYECKECGEEFEKLVRGATEIECPKCGSHKVDKKVSTFSFSCRAHCNACQMKGGGDDFCSRLGRRFAVVGLGIINYSRVVFQLLIAAI